MPRRHGRPSMMHCPICAAESTAAERHPEVTLYRCRECGHRFSQIKPGVSPEPYGAAYFENTHRNWFAHPHLALFERLGRLIDREPEPKSVIDVGCGTGNLLRYLSVRSKAQLALSGLDLRANAPEPGIEYIQGDALTVNVDRQFSVVTSLAAIEHIPNVRAYVGRLKALAKPGGLVIVMTLNDDSLLYAAARVLRRARFELPFNRLYSRHHIHHFSRRSLSRLTKSEGLESEREILHEAPLSALDIPATSRAVAVFLRLGVGLLFAIGSLTRRTYLQTLVCRRLDR